MSNQRRVVLAFLAHPDDAEIFCAGTLIRLHQEHGYQVHIATCTPGDLGSNRLPPHEIASTRRAEAERAAARVGGTFHCLERSDARVVYEPEAIQRAIDLFRRVNPTLVLTHPRQDYMLDHEECHKLGRMASFAYAAPFASAVPLPAEAGIPHLYYVDPLGAHDPYSGELVSPTTCVDISSVIEEKARMLACHASQREWLRAHHGIDEYLDAMRRHGELRGKEQGVAYAETFVQHRGHPYPQNDLLTELLT